MQWIVRHYRLLLLVLLLLLCVLACILRGVPMLPASFGMAPVDDAPMEIDPESTASIEASPGTVTFLSGGSVVCTLESRADAEALIEFLLDPHRFEAPEGHTIERVAFAEEVRVLTDISSGEALALSDAKALLVDKPFLCPVRYTTRTVSREAIAYETTEQEDERFALHTRMLLQVGRPGEVMTRTRHIFINGVEQEALREIEVLTIEPQNEVVAIGAYTSRHPDEEPGTKEGIDGKEAPEGFDLGRPCDGACTSNFGMRNGLMHNGLDYPLALGGEIRAMEAGTVSYIGERGNYGLLIEIDHGNGFITRMAPLQTALVTLGETVEKGQAVATLGPPVDEEGETHLHVELLVDGIPYNPRQYM